MVPINTINNFFLHSSGMVDNNCRNFDSTPIYEIKIRSRYHCLECNEVSVSNNSENCLSLSLEGVNMDILDLLKRYFEDELFERLCRKCGSKSAAMGNTIINIPHSKLIRF